MAWFWAVCSSYMSSKPSCPVLTGWHHHLLISSRSFHRLMDKAEGHGSSCQGSLWARCLAVDAVFTLRCLRAAPHQQPAWPFWIGREGEGEKNGTKREQEEEVGKRGAREERWAVCGLWGGKGPGIWLITGRVRVQGQCPGPSSL